MDALLDDIIAGCKSNNRKSQEKLYRMFFPKMFSLCTKYTNDEDNSMMILNDGFLKVFKNIHQYDGRGSFEGWVRKLVFHCLSDFYRRENKYLSLLIFEEKDVQGDFRIIDQLYFEDLMKLIDKLQGNTHRVFNLYAIEGYTHREISELLSISEGTSKWHLSQARAKLKSFLLSTNNSINHAG